MSYQIYSHVTLEDLYDFLGGKLTNLLHFLLEKSQTREEGAWSDYVQHPNPCWREKR